jgi:hypothetical protein
MLGTHEINVEEGFWRIEEHYSHHHRFDVCCRKYLEEQQRFYDYKLTHSRKGNLHTPVGLIHGRYDGKVGFGINCPAWGCFEGSDADRSWEDILKLYYPLNKEFVMDHYGPTDKPVGYQTGTPYGQADVLPIEYSKDIYKDYKLLSFAGYNCAEKEDLDALKEFVEKGGKLLEVRKDTFKKEDEYVEKTFTFEKAKKDCYIKIMYLSDTESMKPLRKSMKKGI